jgi:hypothetical protein
VPLWGTRTSASLLSSGTSPAEPPGWEWLWELKPKGADSTQVSLTYDWSKVTDRDLLAKIKFPLVSEADLEQSLGRLAEAESGS